MLKQSASGHRPCRAKRETCEKGTMWTDGLTPRLAHLTRPACLARLSCGSVFLLCHTWGAIEVLLCQNGFSAACEAGNCCYRSFASVASNIFILLRMFFSPASPGRHTGRSGRHDGR